jgi:ethanolaminephosphotransferase
MTTNLIRQRRDEVPHRLNDGRDGGHREDENGHVKSKSNPTGFYFLSNDAVRRLPHFHYKGEDRSLLYRYILSPLAEFLVQNCVPLHVAPNTITLSGLIFMFVAYMAAWFYFPGLDDEENNRQSNGPAPAWIFVLNGIAILVYQTLDNMDGKQARRTKSSSPLGLLFDHGCDAVNCIIGSTNWILSLGLDPKNSTNDFLICWIIVMGPFAQFYFSTWEEYYTGELILPIINGPNEGLLGGAVHSFTTAVLGRSFWTTSSWYNGIFRPLLPSSSAVKKIFFLGTRNVDLEVWLAGVGFVQEIMLKTLHIIRRYGLATLINLVPFLILVSCTLAIGLYDRDIWLRMPRTTLHLCSGLFVNMATQLMLDHITDQEFYPFKQVVVLLPLILLTKWTTLDGFDLVDTDEFLLVYATTIWTYIFLKFKVVIFEICAVLKIRCFEINYAPTVRRRSAHQATQTRPVHMKEN